MIEAKNRRDFLSACGRLGLGSTLAGVGVVLGARSMAAGACVNHGMCGGCARFDQGCGLPDAQRIRRLDEPRGHGHG